MLLHHEGHQQSIHYKGNSSIMRQSVIYHDVFSCADNCGSHELARLLFVLNNQPHVCHKGIRPVGIACLMGGREKRGVKQGE